MITNSPFYTPTSNYNWSGPVPFPATPLGDVALNETNQEGAFADWLARYGMFGTHTGGQFGQSLWGQTQRGYAGAQTKNPLLKWTEYLGTVDPRHVSQMSSPLARGEQPQRYQGQLHYQMRSE